MHAAFELHHQEMNMLYNARPVRSVDRRVVPNQGEIGIYWPYSDYTDIFNADHFNADEWLQQSIDQRDDCEVINP
jgi:hypothetical protein